MFSAGGWGRKAGGKSSSLVFWEPWFHVPGMRFLRQIAWNATTLRMWKAASPSVVEIFRLFHSIPSCFGYAFWVLLFIPYSVHCLKTSRCVVQGISLDDFRQFCQFLNNLDDFSLTMKMYTYAQKSVSQGRSQPAQSLACHLSVVYLMPVTSTFSLSIHGLDFYESQYFFWPPLLWLPFFFLYF